MTEIQSLDPHLHTWVVHQYPLGTWLENIAVRSDGHLLVTSTSKPELYLIDPFSSPQTTTLVHIFSEVLGLTGIIEINRDVFYVAGGNFNTSNFSNEQGSYKVWEVDLTNSDTEGARVREVTAVPGSGLLNGMELLSGEKRTILIADSEIGCVWKLDIHTGKLDVVIQIDEMKPPEVGLPMGINGIRIRDGYLYWSNTGKQTFCRIKVDEQCKAIGEAEILLRECTIDDFVFDKSGNAWLTQHTLNTVAVMRENGSLIIVAGDADALDVASGTACQFGRTKDDEYVLYVTTTGGMAGPVKGEVIEGGKVVALDTKPFKSM